MDRESKTNTPSGFTVGIGLVRASVVTGCSEAEADGGTWSSKPGNRAEQGGTLLTTQVDGKC